MLGASNLENGIRIKIQESRAGQTLMTREHNKKGSFRACLASDSSYLQKQARNSHRDKRKIVGLLLSDGLDMT